MHDVLREEPHLPTKLERYIGFSGKTLSIIAIFVVLVGMYIGVILFGENSVEAFIQLQEYEEHLDQKVSQLKQENAQIQKEYFELKQITSGE